MMRFGMLVDLICLGEDRIEEILMLNGPLQLLTMKIRTTNVKI